MPGDAGEATQAADQASATDIVAEMRRVCREDLEEGALDISAKRGREGCARHAGKHAVLPMVRGDDTCRNVLRKVPVISVPLQVLVVSVDVAGCALAIEIGPGLDQRGNRGLPAVRADHNVASEQPCYCRPRPSAMQPTTRPLESI